MDTLHRDSALRRHYERTRAQFVPQDFTLLLGTILSIAQLMHTLRSWRANVVVRLAHATMRGCRRRNGPWLQWIALDLIVRKNMII
jgi:hypothetical protein